MKSVKQKIKFYLIYLISKYLLGFYRCYQYIHHFFISYFKKENTTKVFCIGSVKTGTTSMYKALKILGYRTVQILRGGKEPKEGWAEYIKKLKYDAYVDYPMFEEDLFIQIDRAIPNSKFILTIRDNASWEISFKNFFLNASEKQKTNVLKGINKHNEKVINYFKDRPSQLLVMNIIDGDGWEKICKFLNKPIPAKSFPHKNKGLYKKSSI
jgi:hypothetical protein